MLVLSKEHVPTIEGLDCLLGVPVALVDCVQNGNRRQVRLRLRHWDRRRRLLPVSRRSARVVCPGAVRRLSRWAIQSVSGYHVGLHRVSGVVDRPDYWGHVLQIMPGQRRDQLSRDRMQLCGWLPAKRQRLRAGRRHVVQQRRARPVRDLGRVHGHHGWAGEVALCALEEVLPRAQQKRHPVRESTNKN